MAAADTDNPRYCILQAMDEYGKIKSTLHQIKSATPEKWKKEIENELGRMVRDGEITQLKKETFIRARPVKK